MGNLRVKRARRVSQQRKSGAKRGASARYVREETLSAAADDSGEAMNSFHAIMFGEYVIGREEDFRSSPSG